MQRVECTENTYQKIERSGLSNKIRNEVFQEKEYSMLGYHHVSTAAELAKIGREICGALELPKRTTFGFRTLDDLHLAIGAYCIGESPVDHSSWRKHGRKTYIFDDWGEGILLTQKRVDRPGIFVPETQGRTLALGAEEWPMFLGLALAYFKMSNPMTNVGAFVSRHFKERCEHQEDDEEALVRVKSVKRREELVDRKPTLEDSVKKDLKAFFAQPLPEVSVQPMDTTGLVSPQRTYHPFVAGENLHIGIQIGREWESEDQSAHSTKVQVMSGQKIIKVRDWIRFSPKDSSHLLIACLRHYCSDRAGVPEIVDMFTLGRYMDEQTRGLKTFQPSTG